MKSKPRLDKCPFCKEDLVKVDYEGDPSFIGIERWYCPYVDARFKQNLTGSCNGQYKQVIRKEPKELDSIAFFLKELIVRVEYWIREDLRKTYIGRKRPPPPKLLPGQKPTPHKTMSPSLNYAIELDFSDLSILENKLRTIKNFN
jgi:hypothetical protein